MSKEGQRLALVPTAYQPVRSTLPPAAKGSTSGRYAAVLPAIPQFAELSFEANDTGFIPESTDFEEVEPGKISKDMLILWLQQFHEFTEIDDQKIQDSIARNLFEFTEKQKQGTDVTDEQLIAQFKHLLAIKNGDQLNISRKYFEEAHDKTQYLDFYLQHFPQWQSMLIADRKENSAAILTFLTGRSPMPENEEVAAYINFLQKKQEKKNSVREKLRSISEENLPEAARYPVQLYLEKIIDENPEIETEAVLTQLNHLVFTIIQERSRYHSGPKASGVSQELRLVATVLETHSRTLEQVSSPDDMRQTRPDMPTAIALEQAQQSKQKESP